MVLVAAVTRTAAIAAGLTGQQRSAVQHLLDGMLRERSGGSPSAVLTGAMHLAVGVVVGRPAAAVSSPSRP